MGKTLAVGYQVGPQDYILKYVRLTHIYTNMYGKNIYIYICVYQLGIFSIYPTPILIIETSAMQVMAPTRQTFPDDAYALARSPRLLQRVFHNHPRRDCHAPPAQMHWPAFPESCSCPCSCSCHSGYPCSLHLT